MKITTRPMPGAAVGYNFYSGRRMVGRVILDVMRDRYCPMLRVPNEGNRLHDGARWHWRLLPTTWSCQEACDALRDALAAAPVASVSDRIVIAGIGLSQESVNRLTAAFKESV